MMYTIWQIRQKDQMEIKLTVFVIHCISRLQTNTYNICKKTQACNAFRDGKTYGTHLNLSI